MELFLTGRTLHLKALGYEHLQNIVERGSLDLDYDLKNLEVPPVLLHAMCVKLGRMAELPRNEQPWYTFWLMIHKHTLQGMGFIGFKGWEKEGTVEVGYGIGSVFSGKGYATEALGLLTRWAFGNPRCHTIVARDVDVDNVASHRVLEKNGFQTTLHSPARLNFALSRVQWEAGQRK